MTQTYESEDILDRRVEDVMQPALPTIGAGEAIDRAASLLEHAQALLVLDGGRPRTVISNTDMLSYVSPDEV